MLFLPSTQEGNSDRTYSRETSSALMLAETQSRCIDYISSPGFKGSQQSSGEYYLDADDDWLYGSLYLYNMLWICYSEVKNSYTYDKTSGDSSLQSIDRMQEKLDYQCRPTQIKVRMGSNQITQFLRELNSSFDIEIFFEQPDLQIRTNRAFIVCNKRCVDEWIVSLAPTDNGSSTQIISVMARLHFESEFYFDLIVAKTAILQVKSYISINSPTLVCFNQPTICGDVIRIHTKYRTKNHPEHHDISYSISELLDVIDANYRVVAEEFPLYECPLAPRSIVSITSALRKKITVCEIPQPTDIIRKIILLKKHEVSFLMGFQGTRINSIRKSSACVIKVLPFATTIDATFMPLKNTPQDLVICGTRANVQYGINLIQNYLVEYSDNNSCR